MTKTKNPVIERCEEDIRNRLSTLCGLIAPSKLMVAIGESHTNGGFGQWRKKRVMGAGVFVALCRLRENDTLQKAARVLRSVVFEDTSHSTMTYAQVIDQLHGVIRSVAAAMSLLDPVSRFPDPPRLSLQQVAHAMDRAFESADTLRNVGQALDRLMNDSIRRKARPAGSLEVVDST